MKYQLPRSCMKGQQCRDDVKGQAKTYWGEVMVPDRAICNCTGESHLYIRKTD